MAWRHWTLTMVLVDISYDISLQCLAMFNEQSFGYYTIKLELNWSLFSNHCQPRDKNVLLFDWLLPLDGYQRQSLGHLKFEQLLKVQFILLQTHFQRFKGEYFGGLITYYVIFAKTCFLGKAQVQVGTQTSLATKLK